MENSRKAIDSKLGARTAFVNRQRAGRVSRSALHGEITEKVHLDAEFEARRGLIVASTMSTSPSRTSDNPLVDELEAFYDSKEKDRSIEGRVSIKLGARQTARGDEKLMFPAGCGLHRQSVNVFTISSSDARFTFKREKPWMWRLTFVMTSPTSGRGAGRHGRANGDTMEPSH